MDHQRDFAKFEKLVRRLASTLGKFCDDELVESWWKALRHVDYGVVESNVDRYLGRADDKTPFPRPGQMRPKDLAPPDPGAGPIENPIRGYWRSAIVHEVACAMDFRYDLAGFEQFVIAHKGTLGRAMRELLDELDEQEIRQGRSAGMHEGCIRRCAEIAGAFRSLLPRMAAA